MRRLPLLCCCVLLTAVSSRAQQGATFNFSPQDAPNLVAAARESNVTLAAGDAHAKTFSGSLLVWEAQAANDITPETAQALGEYVRNGGSLLLTLSENPGSGPLRLAFMLPTTAWETQRQNANRGKPDASVVCGESDFWPLPTELKNLTLPFYFPLRPFMAVERGQQRYERFARNIFYINQPVTAGEPFWTRPLLNHDWTARLFAADVGHTPLLLTGHYGAGQVAVFASSAKAIDSDAQAKTLWAPLFKLLVQPPIEPARPITAPTVEAEPDVANHALRVTLHNPNQTPATLRVLARVATWERALVGDVSAIISLPAKGQNSVSLPLPKPGATNYQALDYDDSFDVRLGVFNTNGTQLLSETRHSIDLSPAVNVAVTTDNVRSAPYAFKAPGPEVLDFPTRMGMEINNYAYPPGKTVNARVRLTNGTYNIAPLAAVRDEVKPDNASVSALNDGAAHGEQNPGPDKIAAYGAWVAQGAQTNIVSFTFPQEVTLCGVTLVGSPDNYRNYLTHNPGACVVDVDGKEVAQGDALDQRFQDEAGEVRLAFAPVRGRVLRLTLPWSTAKIPNSAKGRSSLWLGEVLIDGSTASLPTAVSGALTVSLRDALSGTVTPVGTKTVTVQPGAMENVSFSFPAPPGDAPRFYSLEATYRGMQGNAPLMVLKPAQPLQALKDLKPASAPDLGFIVSRGFRSVMETGTGTDEIPPLQWATPDDLIWAYSHQMKQLGAGSRTQANRLYVTESDMRHYSTPWRDFPDATYFYDIAPEMLVERMKRDTRWKDSDRATLSHSDRWDSAPEVDSLHGWQDFIGFDEYLQSQKLPGLKGRTRQELTDEIHSKYESRWQAWNLQRYIGGVHNLRETFAKEGKQLIITSQGSPLVPAKYEKDLTATIRGQSDDTTWGMMEENVTLSLGRQMGILAFNPGWQMSTLLQWGWDSAVLNNPHWHNPVGTTESSRRHTYDRAWRGALGWDGHYKSIHTYGYAQNGGFSFTMTPNDWQEFWRAEERYSLIGPEAPIGAGLVISTARFADPDHTAWSGTGGWGKSAADDQVRAVERAVRRLQEAGISVPFTANAGTLEAWKGDAPLILLELCDYSDDEIAALEKLKARGVRLVAFSGGPEKKLSAAAAKLFGVQPDGSPVTARKAIEVEGRSLCVGNNTLLISGHGDDLSIAAAAALAPLLQENLQLPVKFAPGTAGYGFVSQGKKFLVVEDWQEQGRSVSVRLRAKAGAANARAADVNDHRVLAVQRDGTDWVIDVPLRPADAALVCIEES